MWRPPKGGGPCPPSPCTHRRSGPALDRGSRGRGRAAHDSCGQQPAPDGELGVLGGWVSVRVGIGWVGGHALQLHLLSLHFQVWELRERLDRVRGFWAGLPLAVCGDPRMALDITQEAAPCWTGTGRGR